MDSILQDVRSGVRTLIRKPGFTAVAVITLALGIGANTAIFSIANSVLLKPLHFPDPHGIVAVSQEHAEHGIEDVAPGNFLDWRERSRSFQWLSAIEPFSMDYMGPDGPLAIPTWLVTEGFFEILSTPTILGRLFSPSDFEPSSERVVVLGYTLWARLFGGDPSIVGRTLVLDNAPATVIGVIPPEFQFPVGRELWAPKIFSERERENRASTYYHVIGRLRPDLDISAARAELAGIAEQLSREYPLTNANTGIVVVPLQQKLTGAVRPALLILLGAVGFVLLIACVNVANLMLVQAVHREREFGIRSALGATQRRLTRQLLSESLLLALLGGVVALALAYGGVQVITALELPAMPHTAEINLDQRVLAYALLLSLAAAAIVGLIPAFRVARADLQQRLRAAGHAATASRSARHIRSTLVVGQLAMALVLLIGAGLLVRSFMALVEVDPGYRTDNVLTVNVHAWQYYPSPRLRANFVHQAVDRIAGLPGVRAAGVTTSLPLTEGIGAEIATFEIEGQPIPSTAMPTAHAASVTAGYFHALGIALLRGRLFEVTDDMNAPPVVVVNETFARRYWPGEDAVGRRLIVQFAGTRAIREVIGIVADVRHGGLDEYPRPTMFVPHGQAPSGSLIFVVRTTGDPVALLPAVREAIWTMNRAMPIASATTFEALVTESLADRRFHLSLLLVFSLVALGLAALGVYAVVSHDTSRRTKEMAVRIALGARPRTVTLVVVREGLRLAAIAVVVGTVLALLLTRILGAFLFGVTPHDPITFASLALLLLIVAMLASFRPARSAARTDPAAALRAE